MLRVYVLVHDPEIQGPSIAAANWYEVKDWPLFLAEHNIPTPVRRNVAGSNQRPATESMGDSKDEGVH